MNINKIKSYYTFALLGFVILSSIGCSNASHLKMAHQLSDPNKMLGTDDPSFIGDIKTVNITNKGNAAEPDAHDKSVAKVACKFINTDTSLLPLQTYKLLSVPKCVGTYYEHEADLNIHISVPDCSFLKTILHQIYSCFETTVTYEINGETKAEFKIDHTLGATRSTFAVGHLRNMLIASALRKNENNKEWQENFKRYCKEVKGACN